MSEEGAESGERRGVRSAEHGAALLVLLTHSHSHAHTATDSGTSPLERGDETYLSICLLPAPSEGTDRHIEREKESERKRKGTGERERGSGGDLDEGVLKRRHPRLSDQQQAVATGPAPPLSSPVTAGQKRA